MYEYSYLIWAGIFLLVWLVFFLLRKDLRKEMLTIGLLFGIGGVLSQLMHIQDWWQPLTLTGTRIGIEDFLIGFAIGGISSVIYQVIFKKKEKKDKEIKKSIRTRYILILFLIIFFLMAELVNSFYSTVFAYLISSAIILVKRKDLVKSSLISGILMTLLGAIIYFIMLGIYPGFIKQFWFLDSSWYSQLIFGVPLGEYIWFFLTGAFISTLYKYWQGWRVK